MSLLTACPIGCQGTACPTRIVMPEGHLLQCSDCGQLFSQCSESRYQDSMQEFDVAEGTSPNAQSIHRANTLHSKRLELIKQTLSLPAEAIGLLDVGCSSGAFLDTAKRLGFQTHGIEPAEKAATTAMSRGHAVKIGLLEANTYPEASFDAVTLFEVIEHLKEPLPLLKTIYQVLKPGGVLMLSTGNAKSLTVQCLKEKWDYFSIHQHGGHISFFNPESMQKLASMAGFKVERLMTRNVKFKNKGEGAKWVYRIMKVLSELTNPFAKWFGRGHDMIVLLKKAE